MSTLYFALQHILCCYVHCILILLLYRLQLSLIWKIDKVNYILAGYFIPDVIVAAVIGAVTSLSVGPLVPVIGNWLARSSIMQFLLHITVVTLALSSQLFPYSKDAPKRLVLQHTIQTGLSITS